MAIYEFIINNVQKVTINVHDGTVTIYYKAYDISRVGDFPVNDWSHVQEVVHAHSINKLNGHGLISAITMEASPFMLDQCAKKPITTVYGRVQEETVRQQICGQFCPATRYRFSVRKVIFGREFGYSCVVDAWPKVNPCFVGPRTERDNEIRDYILKQAKAAGIELCIRDESPEDLIYYLISLLVRNRNNAEAQRERADGYLEKIDRLQKELDSWDCWYNDKEHYVK